MKRFLVADLTRLFLLPDKCKGRGGARHQQAGAASVLGGVDAFTQTLPHLELPRLVELFPVLPYPYCFILYHLDYELV